MKLVTTHATRLFNCQVKTTGEYSGCNSISQLLVTNLTYSISRINMDISQTQNLAAGVALIGVAFVFGYQKVLFALLLVSLAALTRFMLRILWHQVKGLERDTHQKFANSHLPAKSWGLPIAGCTLDFVLRGPDVSLNLMQNKKVRTMQLFLLGEWTVFVSGAENLRKILLGEGTLVETEWPDTTKQLVGEHSLLNMTDRQHTQLRRIFNPMFTHGKLVTRVSDMEHTVRKFVKQWTQQQKVALHVEANRCMFAFILPTMIAADANATEVEAMRKDVIALTDGLLAIPIPFGGDFSKGLSARTRIITLLRSLINRRTEKMEAGEDVPNDGLQDLINSSARAGHELTDEQIEDHINLLIFAGVDTSCVVVLNAVYELSRCSQHIRDKLYDEQQNIIKNHGEKLDASSLAAMTYLNCVINEVMRLRPPVAGGFRRALQTFTLIDTNGIVQIPAGTKIAYSIANTISLHNTLGESGFDPDQWLKEGGKALNVEQFAFVPFGGGRRVCLGRDLAMIMIKSLLAVLLRECTWTIDNDPVKWKLFPFPQPIGGLHVNFSER
eukprot:m.130165 g.130165  ORF g.130165 m.130165 type:complete len:555 (+) comp14596_c0_seq2:104-1768(+)